MITRIQIDGFKSLADLDVSLPPLVAIVGPNASGKSNIFDAITLLSRVVTMPLAEALAQGRGEPEEQFRKLGDGTRVLKMTFAVEMLIETYVTDDFDQRERVEHNRLRYELHIERREDSRGVLRPYVSHEAIKPISKTQDRYFDNASEAFKVHRLRYEGSQWKILATEQKDERLLFLLRSRRARGSPQGRLQELPAVRASSTVLSSITTASDYPLLFAVRKEMASWRFLQLDAAALRLPTVSGSISDHLQTDGANLAWILHLIALGESSGGYLGLVDIAADLARVIKGFSSIDVSSNEARGQWEMSLTTNEEGQVSARVASDGTLRLIALLAALYEPETPGVLAFEEPENGINPQRLGAMLDVLGGLVIDPQAQDQTQPLTQLLLTSHSPLVLLKLPAANLVVVDSVQALESTAVRRASRVTRTRRVYVPGDQLLVGDWPNLTEGELRKLPGIQPEDARRLLEV